MAIAPRIDDSARGNTIIASYGDEERVYLRFGTAIDPDLAPLAADLSFSDRLGKVAVKHLEFQSGRLGQLLVATLERALSDDGRRCVHYHPTQWRMCTLASAEDIAPFEQEVYPKAIELLDPSLRQSAEPGETGDDLSPVDAEPWIRSACEFRIRVSFGQALDVTRAPTIDDFRAELDDRWLKITDARFVKDKPNAPPELLIEVSEPIEPGRRVVLEYRSPERHLVSIEGAPLEAFALEALVGDESEELPQPRPAENSALQAKPNIQAVDFVERALAAKAKLDPTIREQLEDEVAGRDPLDLPEKVPDAEQLIDDVDAITRDWDVEGGDEGAGEEAQAGSALPEDDPSMAQADEDLSDELADFERAVSESKKQAIAERLEADDGTHLVTKPTLSLSAKIIYFVPIMVFIWLLFVICLYVATIVFDLDMSRLFSGADAGRQPMREACTIVADDGSRYEGQCVNGQINGQGVYTWASGNRYEGAWLDGKRHGRGVLNYASGARYEGDFRDGIEHGRGKMTWPNGARYEGFYEQGRFHGEGIYYSANGNRFEGVFHQGSMTKDGRCTMKSGEEFAGPCRGN